jgi:hypothetical protein
MCRPVDLYVFRAIDTLQKSRLERSDLESVYPRVATTLPIRVRIRDMQHEHNGTVSLQWAQRILFCEQHGDDGNRPCGQPPEGFAASDKPNLRRKAMLGIL